MWGDDELLRLGLEAVCLVVASVTAALVARRSDLVMGTVAGFAAGVICWLAMLVIGLRWFGSWS